MQFLATVVEGPHHSIFGAYTMPPFRFQPRNGSIDRRRMSVLDVDRVTRELDVATLQENLIDITFCTLDWEVCSHCSQPLDQALLNVLRLAQLTIEYLLHGQDFLTTTVTLLELHLQASLSQQSQRQQVLDCQAEELRNLQEERHQQHQMIKDLQQLLQQSGGQSYYMCHLCEKMFLSASSLWSHLQRRHEGTAQGETQEQEESMEEVVRDLRAQLTSTQEELTAVLEKQWQLQEAKTTCQRERGAKAMFEEWSEELSEEIEHQEHVVWDELKSSVLPDSPLEEKPVAQPSGSAVCSSLESLQDAECEEILRQTQEYETLRMLKETKIQERELKRAVHELEKELACNNRELQVENEELRREKEKIQEENAKLQMENAKLRVEKEELQKEREKVQKENERLHDMLCQPHLTASQSQQHLVSLSTQMQQAARLITTQEMLGKEAGEVMCLHGSPHRALSSDEAESTPALQTQTSSCSEVKASSPQIYVNVACLEYHSSLSGGDGVQCIGVTKCFFSSGSAKGPKPVNMDKDSSKEELDSQDEQWKVLEAEGQNISLLEMFGQTPGDDLQERQESTGRKRDAKEVPRRTLRNFLKQRGEKKEGKFSEWCSKASERAARWFSGCRKRARQHR